MGEAFVSSPLGGDYGTTRLMMVVIGLLLMGGRRLEHLKYIASDPIFGRFRADRRAKTPGASQGRP